VDQQADDVAFAQQVIREYKMTVQGIFARVDAGEVKFGIPYTEAHEAIDDGRLEETAEVCSWLIDIDRYERLIRG
jgi:hypothetical protein